ncbi:MAG: organic hydroperoxide reductase OsmC/OhrA [Flavobacteriales bacterium]|jgi:organic hydroperoxide reductase OsmC/OhrA
MSNYTAEIRWFRKENERYIDNEYSRGHEWIFDGGTVVPASSSPSIVPLPFSIESNVDPEEAFIASLSSCHMLFFLSIAAKRRFVIDSYIDEASAIMEASEEGRISITKVWLKPLVVFSGEKQPTKAQIGKMHHKAHEQCFIANSIKAEVTVDSRW